MAPVAPEMIRAQVEAVVDDIGVDAVKVGMLGSAATVAAVAAALDGPAGGDPVVVDPVMVAESGGRLLEPTPRQALRDQLLPLATVVTPNVAEARVLARATTDRRAARRRRRRGAGAGHPRARPGRRSCVTGGHRETRPATCCSTADADRRSRGSASPAGAAHGSGCTHSSVLAARLALGDTLRGGGPGGAAHRGGGGARRPARARARSRTGRRPRVDASGRLGLCHNRVEGDAAAQDEARSW